MPESGQTRIRETRNMAFAAYVHMRGLQVSSAKKWKRGQITEFEFAFRDEITGACPDGVWEQLKVDYANSESLKFDNSVRTLKKLCSER